MTEETTTEQLAEIEGQGESTPGTEYTPPEGWRVLQSGELLQPGDHWVNWEGTVSRPDIQHGDGATVSGGRYIRWVKPQTQPEPQPVQVREGRWRTRHGWVRNVTPTPEGDARKQWYPWWDAQWHGTWTANGQYQLGAESTHDLIEYLGPIEEPQPSPQPEQQAAAIEELRSEVSYVQRLLGESNRKVAQLEDLVGSLRTINEVQEKAFTAAGKENTALRNQLAAVKAELATKAETSRRLQMELDAAQQVPADSPELRQLRADLEQMTLGRDTYQDGYERVLSDLVTIRATTKAETVEAIAEWLEPIRLADSAYLANATMQHLPSIMRHLTGLDSHAID